MLRNNFYLCIMKEFSLHINYLIQKHDCVIIPDFGGFVLHRDAAKIAEDGSIIPPRVSVGFNPELKYNDGLLAESYMNAYSVSYDVACKKIGDVVYRLNTILGLRQPAPVGALGTLILDEEKRLSFIPNSEFSLCHPETFGLDTLDIKRLIDIEETRKVEVIANRKTLYQRIFVSVGATAAAIAVFFVTSTPINEPQGKQAQKSGFFADIFAAEPHSNNKITNPILVNQSVQNSLIADDTNKPAENTLSVIESESTSGNAAQNDVKKEQSTPILTVEASKPAEKETTRLPRQTSEKKVKQDPVARYYVIIGSAGNKTEAQHLLVMLQSQGYRKAAILNSKERPRIYISMFEDKAKAEQYAANFRRNNPRLSDAWVYTKRN